MRTIDVAIPSHFRLGNKNKEKIEKYQELKRVIGESGR